jgi:hypothetical protein
MTEPDDWTPQLDSPAGDQFKWGLNGDTGQLTIWEVAGPGDGFPSHETYLATAWGRRPRFDGQDVLGYALADQGTVLLVAYQQQPVPAELHEWAKTTFPGLQLRFQLPATLRPS